MDSNCCGRLLFFKLNITVKRWKLQFSFFHGKCSIEKQFIMIIIIFMIIMTILSLRVCITPPI